MSRCAESRVGAAGGQPGERTYVHMTSHHDCFSLFPPGWWTLWGPGSQLQPLPPALVTPRTSHQAHRLRAPTRRSWGRPGSERQGGGAAGLEQGLPPLRSPAPPPPGPYRNTGTPVRRGPPEGRRGQRRAGPPAPAPAPPRRCRHLLQRGLAHGEVLHAVLRPMRRQLSEDARQGAAPSRRQLEAQAAAVRLPQLSAWERRRHEGRRRLGLRRGHPQGQRVTSPKPG